MSPGDVEGHVHDDPDETGSRTPRRVTRRRVLVVTAALGAGGVAAGISALRRGPTAIPPALGANLAGLPGVEHWRRIGDAVLAAGAAEPDVTGLTATVAPSDADDPVTWCSETDPAELTRHVRAQSSDDFVSGGVRIVEGWRIARTEAALAALTALDARP